MSAIKDVLDRYNVGLTEQDLAGELDAALRSLQHPGSAPLSAHELEYLTQHAGEGTNEVLAQWDPVHEQHRHAVAVASSVKDLVASSLSRTQAAQQLGVDPSGISRRIHEDALWSFKVGSRLRIPSWQFAGNALLPGLAEIVAAIPDDAHPLDIAAMMTSPHEFIDGHTPAQWLAAGRDPSVIVSMIEDLNRW
ncbi:helix-turn-helix domain-containing protein [Hoyosella sp. YIM 151337]|uniref:helix-turn-helix domain-containing protein n=1 Tax=Hoyosella sp. YIM 151337 TaxID=2992742 RepID=UPI002235E565|nr:helix-turn-helix domain-containing protein [Hoyosella sp. YIM 151337]MCW4354135.1 helix-turn-helix domain-containing protein [Hoyosella sp. YIM 151337]